jgi:two-component system sensor histidine kinase/response regulator
MMSESEPAASILIVDDTVENLRLLSGILSARGYDVRPVTTGTQAIRAALSAPPDLVLLDISMPDMDGYEVCRRLKQSEVLNAIPVIFLTALTDVGDKVKGFAVGGADYVTKPFQMEEVLSRVDAHVALGRARTQLQGSYRRLQVLERLRDDLVHMIVHDMRSPLAVLIAHLDLVSMDPDASLGPDARDSLREATRGARELNRMANELLDVSKLEEGKMSLERTPCDLVEVTREVAATLGAWARGRSISVDPSKPIVTSCDRQLIRRVLENLVSNAIKHTPSTGSIHIVVEDLGKEVRVGVADQGNGVPVDLRSRIFEKFGSAATRADGSYHSVGLGLAFCKLAVEAHGGRIGVDDGPGGGSVFWFDLPN